MASKPPLTGGRRRKLTEDRSKSSVRIDSERRLPNKQCQKTLILANQLSRSKKSTLRRSKRHLTRR